jgi:hypothetical protein
MDTHSYIYTHTSFFLLIISWIYNIIIYIVNICYTRYLSTFLIVLLELIFSFIERFKGSLITQHNCTVQVADLYQYIGCSCLSWYMLARPVQWAGNKHARPWHPLHNGFTAFKAFVAFNFNFSIQQKFSFSIFS